MVNRLKLNEKTVREAENLWRDYQIFDTDVRGFFDLHLPVRQPSLHLGLPGRRAAAADDHRALHKPITWAVCRCDPSAWCRPK